jgi:hypothetical protein
MKPDLKDGEKVIKKIDMYYSGWDCDSEAWVVENEKGERHCIGTNHGGQYVMSIAELKSFIETYEEAVKETNEAIDLLTEKN